MLAHLAHYAGGVRRPDLASALPRVDDDRRVADGMLVVHPAWHLKGLGAKLFTQLEARLQESGVDTCLLRFYLDPALEAAVAFARSQGLEPFEPDTYTEMRAVVSEVDTLISLLEGFTLRPYREVDHLPTLVEALDQGYAGLHDHHRATAEDLEPRLAELDWDGHLLPFTPDGTVAGTVGAAFEPSRTERNGVPTTAPVWCPGTAHRPYTRRCCSRVSPTCGGWAWPRPNSSCGATTPASWRATRSWDLQCFAGRLRING